MIPKFRIYDKQEEKYCEEDAPLMLCMAGFVYDMASENWYGIGERYVVEFLVTSDSFGVEYFECDVVESGYGYGYPNPEVIKVREFMCALTECTVDEDIKVIGTIHDEKYKGL